LDNGKIENNKDFEKYNIKILLNMENLKIINIFKKK